MKAGSPLSSQEPFVKKSQILRGLWPQIPLSSAFSTPSSAPLQTHLGRLRMNLLQVTVKPAVAFAAAHDDQPPQTSSTPAEPVVEQSTREYGTPRSIPEVSIQEHLKREDLHRSRTHTATGSVPASARPMGQPQQQRHTQQVPTATRTERRMKQRTRWILVGKLPSTR